MLRCSIEAFVERLVGLHAAGGHAALFIGAGLSMAAPANLPGAQGLKISFLEYMARCNPHVHAYVGKNEESLVESLRRVPFEYLGSLAWDMAQPGLFRAFLGQELETKLINRGHLATALLASGLLGHLVLTPNFDTCIERAFELLGLGQNLEVTILQDREWVPDAPGKDHPRLIKVHGCLSSPATLTATLAQVGRGFDSRGQALLHHVLAEHSLVVAGWSDNDYDLTPLFDRAEKPVFWIDHEAGPRLHPEMEAILQRRSSYYLRVDTDAFWSVLCGALKIPPVEVALPLPRESPKQLLQVWAGGEIESLYGAFGSLLLAAGDLSGARGFLDKAHGWLKRKVAPYAAPDILARVSLVATFLGDFGKSSRALAEAIELYRYKKNAYVFLPLTFLCCRLSHVQPGSAEILLGKLADVSGERAPEIAWDHLRAGAWEEAQQWLARHLVAEGFFLEACACAERDSLRQQGDLRTSAVDPNLLEHGGSAVERAAGYFGYPDWRQTLR